MILMKCLSNQKEMNDIGCYFLDIQLEADMNGIKLGSEIRKHDPVGNIIFVTSHSELTYLTFVYKVAAMDFIFKDDPSELKQESLTVLKLLIHVLSCYLKKVMLKQLS